MEALKSFRFNTRQRRAQVGVVTYSSASPTAAPLVLPRMGFLSSVLIFAVFDVSNSGAVTPADLAPYSLLQRVRLSLNNGSQVLCDVSGYGLFLINSVSHQNGRPDQSSNSTVYNFPVSNGSNQTLTFGLRIPVGMSNGLNFEGGLINLQAPEIQCSLELTFASAASQIGSNLTINSGNVYVSYEYYEVPDPKAVMLPPVVVHRWQEDQQPVVQVGNNIYNFPNGGRLMRAISVLKLNGARSASWDSRQFVLNNSDTIINETRRDVLFQQRRLYGYDLPTGVHVLDFAEAWDNPNESDGRDFIDTERSTTIQLTTVVSSGATLGSNNNTLSTIRETIQSFQA